MTKHIYRNEGTKGRWLYDFDNNRVVCWFSCGVTSAVASFIASKKVPKENLHIVYCDTSVNEHPDNQRFLSDVENWLDHKIERVKNPKYDSIWDVFEKTGWLVGVNGARCALELKKQMRFQYEEPYDIQVMGFDESDLKPNNRPASLLSSYPEMKLWCPLLEDGVDKPMAFEIIKRAGIELPFMYRPQKSGEPYGHNNCIGCVKGQKGYWNKIKIDFPDVFERMSKLERKMGVAINKTYKTEKSFTLYVESLPNNSWVHSWAESNKDMIKEKFLLGKSVRVPAYLDDLGVNEGRSEKIDMSCDMLCSMNTLDFLEK